MEFWWIFLTAAYLTRSVEFLSVANRVIFWDVQARKICPLKQKINFFELFDMSNVQCTGIQPQKTFLNVSDWIIYLWLAKGDSLNGRQHLRSLKQIAPPAHLKSHQRTESIFYFQGRCLLKIFKTSNGFSSMFRYGK